MKNFKILIYIILVIVALVLIYRIGLIILAKMTYFDPPKILNLSKSKKQEVLSSDSIFTSMVWNIGYAGLNKEMDYFYDGGTRTRPIEEVYNENLNGILNTIVNNKVDFLLIQEIDSFSKRSYYNNQITRLKMAMSEYNLDFAFNYKVKFIPKPWLNPLGMINSGQVSLSKFNSKSCIRYQLPGDFGFPLQLFFLRRCLLVNRYELDNGKELIIINLHNSAYDIDDKLKSKELYFLKNMVSEEYSKGNYVVCGGDWNMCPPKFNYEYFKKDLNKSSYTSSVYSDLLTNWKWVYDSNIPTNRKNDKPYSKENTFTTLIDYYLVSPNVEIVECKNLDLGFVHSDHNPSKIKFKTY